MNKFISSISVLAIALASQSHANEYSVNAGYSSLTSGFGVGVNYELNNSFVFLSAGCAELKEDDIVAGCGVGTGFQMFLTGDNRHSAGIAYGNIAALNTDPIYGVSINYTYFLNGKDDSGLFVGVGYKDGDKDYKKVQEGFFNIGYKF